MYSTTDTGLPFGQNNPEIRPFNRFPEQEYKPHGLSGIQKDIIAMRDPVRKAFNDLITNW